jgi:hypothetical protein
MIIISTLSINFESVISIFDIVLHTFIKLILIYLHVNLILALDYGLQTCWILLIRVLYFDDPKFCNELCWTKLCVESFFLDGKNLLKHTLKTVLNRLITIIYIIYILIQIFLGATILYSILLYIYLMFDLVGFSLSVKGYHNNKLILSECVSNIYSGNSRLSSMIALRVKWSEKFCVQRTMNLNSNLFKLMNKSLLEQKFLESDNWE